MSQIEQSGAFYPENGNFSLPHTVGEERTAVTGGEPSDCHHTGIPEGAIGPSGPSTELNQNTQLDILPVENAPAQPVAVGRDTSFAIGATPEDADGRGTNETNMPAQRHKSTVGKIVDGVKGAFLWAFTPYHDSAGNVRFPTVLGYPNPPYVSRARVKNEDPHIYRYDNGNFKAVNPETFHSARTPHKNGHFVK